MIYRVKLGRCISFAFLTRVRGCSSFPKLVCNDVMLAGVIAICLELFEMFWKKDTN